MTDRENLKQFAEIIQSTLQAYQANENEGMKEIAMIVNTSMSEFHTAMKFRDSLTIRIARRTTQIIRFSVITILLLAVAMFYLISTLTDNMNNITERMVLMADYMEKMNRQFASVADNMDAMKQAVDNMSRYVSVLPAMNNAVIGMREDMSKMGLDMKKMNQSMALMEKSMGMMSTDMANMSYQFTGLNQYVGQMGYNVDRMASPMRLFPFP
jgi:prophage DNA circulation protein